MDEYVELAVAIAADEPVGTQAAEPANGLADMGGGQGPSFGRVRCGRRCDLSERILARHHVLFGDGEPSREWSDLLVRLATSAPGPSGALLMR